MEQPPGENGRRATTQTTFLRRCRYGGSPTGRSKMTLQGHFEEIYEATANQPGDLGGPRPGSTDMRRSVKIGAAIYEANRIATAKVKRAARNPPSDSRTLTPGINSITPTIIETTSHNSSPVTPTTATTTTFAFTTTTTTISDGDSLLSCPQCGRKFTSRIGLASTATSTYITADHTRNASASFITMTYNLLTTNPASSTATTTINTTTITGTITPKPRQPPPIPLPTMDTRFKLVFIAIAHSPHASTRLATCESIAL
ncbi:unnamed protein product [Schistocephalus solidus]|uniref:C2H2-type domain-containing protein n=1 Tax=Schistocephalus solidus TaxID=70667 RepID=A0A183SM96_SCHSO|nr:unnamed protein product [Schistocephalus solidus]